MENSVPRVNVMNSNNEYGLAQEVSALRGEYSSTRKAAMILGVSLRTIQLWSDKKNGPLRSFKTAGGHRRILCQSVIRILEERKCALREPMQRNARMRIVLVEDDLDLLRLLRKTIDGLELGIDVLAAQNAFEGLALIGQTKPDLGIVDLNMPGMDGFRMIRSLHNSSEFSPRRIIVSTALSNADILDRGGLPENITVLQKPTPFSELEALIRAEQALYLQPAHTMV